jgi:hypothetical protein
MIDMYTKQQNLDMSEKRVHETDISIHEPWDTSDMAHRSGGVSVEQAEKESTLQEISDIGQEIEQEPVAWVRDLTSPQPHCVTSMKYLSIADTDAGVKYIPVYTAPPKREWVGLTDEEIDYIWGISPGDYEDKCAFPRAIEAKLRERNT